MADERPDHDARQRRHGLLAAGDPQGHVADAWTAKEAVREIYRIGDHDLALEWVTELAHTLNGRTYCPEARRLGRMLARWAPQIAAWHRHAPATAPSRPCHQRTAKRVKRVAFGHHQLDPLAHPRPALRRPSRLVQSLVTITPAAP